MSGASTAVVFTYIFSSLSRASGGGLLPPARSRLASLEYSPRIRTCAMPAPPPPRSPRRQKHTVCHCPPAAAATASPAHSRKRGQDPNLRMNCEPQPQAPAEEGVPSERGRPESRQPEHDPQTSVPAQDPQPRRGRAVQRRKYRFRRGWSRRWPKDCCARIHRGQSIAIASSRLDEVAEEFRDGAPRQTLLL